MIIIIIIITYYSIIITFELKIYFVRNSDYNVSEKMYETNNTATIRPMLRENAKSMAKKDWQQFFFPMCFQLGIMFDVSELGTNPSQNLRMIMVSASLNSYSYFRSIFIKDKQSNRNNFKESNVLD